jgi:hypothetical protein
MRPARIVLSIVLLIANLVAILPAAAAPLAQERLAIIASPRDGAQLKGVVQITGTATDPKFDHYELAWAAQSAPENWQLIASVQNQISNGSLGTWDTSQLQPGVYLLRLRVVREGDKVVEAFARELSVNQSTPTPAPLPTTPVGPTIPPSPTRGVITATPTVLILQPPTSTPQVTATAKPGAAVVSTPGSVARAPSIQVNFASFGQAFCNGALYTLLIFIVWGVVVGARGIVRWALRRLRTPTLPKG